MVIDWKTFDFSKLFLDHGTVLMGKQRRKKDKHDTMNLYCAFDIETSTVWLNPDRTQYDVHSFMYSWAFQIEEYTILGREWPEFFAFLHKLREALDVVKVQRFCDVTPHLVCWIHNAA